MKLLNWKISVCLILFLLFLMPAVTHAATYYVRADGTVTCANKANATSSSAVGTSLNMAQVNACTFSAGDQVLFSSAGGNFTTALTVPSGGSGVGSEITYANVASETPVITGAFSQAINTNAQSNIKIKGFSLAVSGDNYGVRISAGSNITLQNLSIDMQGKGWGIISWATISNITIDSVTISNCGSRQNIYYFPSSSSASNVTISNSTINSGVGIQFLQGSNISVIGTVVTPASMSSGISFTSVTGGTISYVSFSGSVSSEGIKLTDSSGINISNITYAGSSYGYRILGTSNNITVDSFTMSAGSGGDVGDTSDAPNNITITNNTITTGGGITIQAGSYSINVNGVSYSGSSNGYLIYGTAHNITINNFNITNGTGALIGLNSGDTPNTITISNSSINNAAAMTIQKGSYGITLNNCSVNNSTGHDGTSGYGFRVKDAAYNITYNNCQANYNVLSGFGADDSNSDNPSALVHNITYNNCSADYNLALGFVVGSGCDGNGSGVCYTPHDITYNYCEASYNGTVNATSDGGGFLPHYHATNVNGYYCVAHHNYNEGIGDVSDGVNAFYNSTFWGNGYKVGDTFNGSLVTPSIGVGTGPTVRGGILVSKLGGTLTLKNNIFGGDTPREIDNLGGGGSVVFDNNIYKPLNDNYFFYNLNSSSNTNDVSWSTYHSTNEPNSINSDPRFINPASNYQLLAVSPAIDSGLSLGFTTTDSLGNPFYGTPDIGAYEYQPSHTITTDKINIASGARIYADGKFRDVLTTGGTTASLKITPQSGIFTTYDATTTRPAWLDVSDISWSNSHKTWTEKNAVSGLNNTLHTIGDLDSNKLYAITVTGASVSNIIGINGTTCSNAICQSDSSGKLSFQYTGGYSTHTFDMQELSNTATLSNLTISQGTLSPSLSSNTTLYTVNVPNSVKTITVTPTATDSHATITSSPSNPISLNVGGNTITVTVIAQDGTTTKTYTIIVTVAQPPSGGGGALALLHILQQQTQPSQTTVTQPTPTLFTKVLQLGDVNSDVLRLQQFLNTHGFPVSATGVGSLNHETQKFGLATKAALIKFQEANAKDILTPSHLTHGTGKFARATINFVNSILMAGK